MNNTSNEIRTKELLNYLDKPDYSIIDILKNISL